MKLLDFLKRERKKSASVAKERLQIIVAHQRGHRGQPDYMPMLEQELLEVIRRYVSVDQDAVNITLDSEDDCSILELNVTLPNSKDDT
ncbi:MULTISPECIES: cell division topological specificity factor MinE [Larsenimonas]|uniref:Cell division topological specificity factor n=1 Tax=Larsenimonas suaedae TaxID=1851019 RepID=A0ABU1GX63_9GAMM|nr:cell division topological specificity factor MinE [Larsenimonas suaedae]MCM2973161.1 cell division topological specificity factor MinE [Larsenimonas suaedae]MCM5705564.1 cell division topological specificity factor MinE [Larsenimonas salina]MDR5896598.1 cell division topological specificity factor MinE [Larsenimonas suaedae]